MWLSGPLLRHAYVICSQVQQPIPALLAVPVRSIAMANSLQCHCISGRHDGGLQRKLLRPCTVAQPFRQQQRQPRRPQGAVRASEEPPSGGNGSSGGDLTEETLRRLEQAEAEAEELRKQLKLARQMQASQEAAVRNSMAFRATTLIQACWAEIRHGGTTARSREASSGHLADGPLANCP